MLLFKTHYGHNVYGAIAQLVERLVRNEKVSGSTPLSSTIHFNLNFKGLNVLQPDSLFLVIHH